MCTDVRPNKVQFAEKKKHILQPFGISDAGLQASTNEESLHMK